ncbi:hypothetical protein M2140_001474 [Clostridiales Family XIII bacterium PM5-7]
MKENPHNRWVRAFLIYNAVLVLLALIPVTFMHTTEVLKNPILGVMFVFDIICWIIVIFKAKQIKKKEAGIIILSLVAVIPAVSQWIMCVCPGIINS